MSKILVFLAINKDLFPHFKPRLALGHQYYFVLRKGITNEHVQSLLAGQEHYFIPYSHDGYAMKKIRTEIHDTFDETWILCRDSGQKLYLLMNIIGAVADKSQQVFLLDIHGGKRGVERKDIYWAYKDLYRTRLKRAGGTLNDIVYRVYIGVVFGIVLILALVLFPFLRLSNGWRFHISHKKPRVCIAKRVHSNQSFIIAKGLRELGYKAFSINLTQHPYNYNRCDLDYVLSHKGRFFRFFILSTVFLYVLFRFDLYLFENNGESFFVSPLWEKWDIPRSFQIVELHLLRWFNKKIIFEMRDCTVYNVPLALQGQGRNICKNCSANRAMLLCGNQGYVRSNRIAMSLCHKIIYSTIDLKPHLPADATWLPNAMIYDDITLQQPDNPRLKIVHSATCEVMKGTTLVTSAISTLQESFEIDLEVIKNLDHHTALQKIKEADLALGQFNAGSYGNFDIECMMHGKPVIGYINPDWLPYYPSDLPIVTIDGDDIERSLVENLTKLIVDREWRADIGRKSSQYALKVHGYKAVSLRLAEIIAKIG